jgi:hypothetical protein
MKILYKSMSELNNIHNDVKKNLMVNKKKQKVTHRQNINLH